MMFSNVLSMWQMTRGRFTEKVKTIDENELSLKLADTLSIGKIIYHTAEVEFMFSHWFFNRKSKEVFPVDIHKDKDALMQFLAVANDHFIHSMELLDESKWTKEVTSRMGKSTPLEAVARLIYHTGIHAGQITTIQKLHNE